MRSFVFAVLSFFAFPIAAAEVTALPARCWVITTATLDISAGAATTSAFDARAGSTGGGGGMTQLPSYLKLGVILTDASNGVTKLAWTFSASETTGGTYLDIDLCSQSGVALTCGDASLERNPVTYGKNYWVKPVDWGYPFGKATVTPTGNGASDSVALTVYGCAE